MVIPVTFHTIRHTVATNLANVLDVRNIMYVNWKVIAMAAGNIHAQEETKRQAANILAGAWKKQEQATMLQFDSSTANLCQLGAMSGRTHLTHLYFFVRVTSGKW